MRVYSEVEWAKMVLSGVFVGIHEIDNLDEIIAQCKPDHARLTQSWHHTIKEG